MTLEREIVGRSVERARAIGVTVPIAPGVHFYTLNRSHSTVVVFENLKAALPATVGAR